LLACRFSWWCFWRLSFPFWHGISRSMLASIDLLVFFALRLYHPWGRSQ
jgi:glucose dehydrogenase